MLLLSNFQRLLNALLSLSEIKQVDAERRIEIMNPQTDKIVRRTTMVATVVASYFLLTADYGPEPNALDPIKKAILSAESSVKEYIFGSKKEPQENQTTKLSSNNAKEHP